MQQRTASDVLPAPQAGGHGLVTAELALRPSRAPDYRMEAEALGRLAEALAERPDDALQMLATTIVDLRLAESAGVSLLDADSERFDRLAVAGAWAPSAAGSLPFDAGLCDIAIDRATPLLFRVPHDASASARSTPLIGEVLLVPFGMVGRQVGIVWAVMHSPDLQFCAEDLRLLQSLARVAAASHRLASTIATERVRVRAEHDRAASLTAAQNRVFEIAVSDAPLSDTLDAVVREVEALSATQVLASILLVDGSGEHLVHGAAPSLPPAYNEAIDGIAIGPTVGSCGTAVHRRQPVFVADIATDPLWADFRDLALAHDLRACWSIPIMSADGRVLGTFAMYHRLPREPSGADLDLIEFVTRSAALVIERKSGEAQLRVSEERLRLATENAEVGFWDVDSVHDVLHWPPRVKAMFGLSPEVPVTLQDFFDGLHPEDREQTSLAYEAAIDPARRTLYNVEYRTVGREDGVVRWIAARGRGQFNDAGRCVRVVGTAVDITDRREAVERLRASEARAAPLAAVIEQSLDFVAIARPDGWPLFVNEAGRRMMGLPDMDAARALRLVDYVADHDRPAITEAALPACAAGGYWEAEVHFRRIDADVQFPVLANIFPVSDPAGATLAYAMVGRDLTEKRRVEAELRHLNETLEARVAERTAERDRAWKNSRDLQLVIGTDGIVRAVNEAWTKLLGYRPNELIGRHFLGLVHDEDAATSQDALATTTATPPPTFEIRLLHRDGGWHCISWVAQSEGDLIYASGRDVTRERAREAELALAQEALRQSQKMEAIGQLTGGVAHDFNNLLTVIRSAADLLRRREVTDEKRRRYVDAIADTADRAAKLTGQLLAFARRQALKPEIFDVSARVHGVAEMLLTVLGSRVALSIIDPPEPCVVEADGGQFETALVNMAVNARDAMDGQGSLSITIDPIDRLPGPHGQAGASGRFVAIRVADTGIGIAPADLGRIFEPFFTTKEVGKGTGLGLSQVFGFARQSGGDVVVRSEPGEGTAFTLYLPRSDAQPVNAHAVAASEAAVFRGRVLVVEDNSDVGEFAVQTLGELGYETRRASCVADAFTILDSGETFDVVFSDVVMPGMSGIEFARILRANWPGLPVVLTSGYSHALAEDASHGFPLVRKPYAVEELATTLRAAITKAA